MGDEMDTLDSCSLERTCNPALLDVIFSERGRDGERRICGFGKLLRKDRRHEHRWLIQAVLPETDVQMDSLVWCT